MKPSTLMCLVVALAVPRFADCASLRMGAEEDESKLLARSSGSSSRSISNKTISLDTAVLRKGSRRRAYTPPPRRRRNPCAVCSTGQYCSSYICHACPAGQFGAYSGTSASCSACSAGQYSHAGSSSCATCTSGRYSSGSQWGSCNAHRTCSPGQYVSRVGSNTYDSMCQGCAAGKFSTSSNAATCTACPVGRSQGTVGQTQCTACPDGTGAPSVGSAGCGACAGGRPGASLGAPDAPVPVPVRFRFRSGPVPVGRGDDATCLLLTQIQRSAAHGIRSNRSARRACRLPLRER